MALASKAFSELITFTRASTAGYYGSDGLYKTAPSGSPRTGAYADYTPAVITQQNLLTYSEDFSQAAWTKSNCFVQTNLLTYSQEFDNAAWGKAFGGTGVAPTVTANQGLAPDGTLTADRVDFNCGGTLVADRSWIVQTFSTTAGDPTTVSVWIKAFDSATIGKTIRFVCENGGAQTTNLFTITDSWQRVNVTGAASTGASNNWLIETRGTYTSSATASVLLWGGQAVKGSVPGDYRATTSAALPILYADYTGALTAMKLCENTATSSHNMYQSSSRSAGIATHTVSFDVKADGSGRYIRLLIADASTSNYSGVFIDPSSGSVVSSIVNFGFTGGSVSVAARGNGWYRVFLTATTDAVSTGLTSQAYLASSASLTNYAGNGSNGVYITAANLNPGATGLPYLATTTSGGVVTTTGSKRGFLVEEQRKNLIVRSNDWSASWSLTNVTQTAAQATGPDGTMSMTKIAATTAAATVCYQASVAEATSQTWSIYAKQGSGPTDANDFAVYNNTTATNLASLSINYATGIITQTLGSGAYAEPIGNGIWRIVVPVTSGITVGNTISGYVGFVGGVQTAGEYAYAYGGQMEPGDKVTSYIPTTTAQVTRAADSARVNTLSPWFSGNAGTFYAEGTNGKYPATLLSMVDAAGYATNSVAVGKLATAPANWSEAAVYNTGGNSALQFDTSTASILKFAFAWDGTTIYAAANGQTTKTGTRSLSLASTTGGLRLGEYFFGNMLNGNLRSVRYYPRVITGTELQALTA